MMKELLIERAEILENFGLEELDDILTDQMNGLFSEVNGIPIDYFKPYYHKYQTIKDTELNADERQLLEDRFYEVSMTFIRKIENVFKIKLDEEWIASHRKDIPSVTLILYSFFYLELGTNIEDAIHRAIKLESENLYKLFEDRKNKKDGSTVTYSKLADPQMALILANIYDATTTVIEDMTEEEYIKYLPDGYVPAEFIKRMMEKGYIVGDFMNVIRQIFAKSTFLKSMTCFNIESHYRIKD